MYTYAIEYRSATSCYHGDEASGSKQKDTCFACVQLQRNQNFSVLK